MTGVMWSSLGLERPLRLLRGGGVRTERGRESRYELVAKIQVRAESRGLLGLNDQRQSHRFLSTSHGSLPRRRAPH